MKNKKKIFSKFYVLLCLVFFYLPILVTCLLYTSWRLSPV